jgi:Na+/glutamate symporter
MVPGRGPVKIAAAMAIAAATFGGGLAYKKFKTYLREKQLRKERKKRRQRDASASKQEQKVAAVRNGAAAKSRKRPRKRKRVSKPAA